MSRDPGITDHPARILIVDDDHNDRQLLQTMLAPEGYVLITAASGEEALAAVAQWPPDLILLDMMMPGMSGYEVAGTIKGHLATEHIPMIMVTALHDRDARMLDLSAGAGDFLTRPVDGAELRVRVRNLLRLKAYGDYHDKHSEILERAALLDLAQDAVFVLDMQGRILFWNRGAEVTYGWLSIEALGRNMNELLGTECAEPAAAIDAELLRRGQWAGEVIHHKRDGTRLTVTSRWALQRDAGGAPVRTLTINNDITGRKQADLDQLQLKDDFLSHVSHELRSPLTAIKQFTTILLGGMAGELNKEQGEYELIVLRNIQQLQSMIDDLLEVTRLENGKLSVELERVSVTDAVTDSFNTLQGTAQFKGVTLSHDVPPDLPAAYADETRLRQILIILLDNAIKFCSDGGAVNVQARLLLLDPRFLLLEVSDTGCGISPEITEKIFERLYQISDPTRATRKGLGLGLYICRQLVTLQGGQIWVKSLPGKGSTFSFTLPVFHE